MRAWVLGLSVALVCAHASAQVEVVFEQASMTSEGDTTNGYYSSVIWNELLYDDATLTQDTDLHSVQVWGYNIESDPEVIVSLFADEGGQVGALIAQRTFLPGDIQIKLSGGFVIGVHALWAEELATFELDPPMRMKSGQRYWIGVSGQYDMGWSYDALSGNDRIFYSDAAGSSFWDQNDTDMAFRLLGQEASPADLAEPYGTLDFTDVVAFLGAFASGDAAADLAPPVGVVDFSDVIAFLASFAAG